jgi:hypothetical protein
MSRDLVPTGGLFASKLDRQTSRVLAQVEAGALVASHRDQARIDRVAATSERAREEPRRRLANRRCARPRAWRELPTGADPPPHPLHLPREGLHQLRATLAA